MKIPHIRVAKVPLLCFAIVVLGLRGIAWDHETQVGHNVKRIVRHDMLAMDKKQNRPPPPPTFSPTRL